MRLALLLVLLATATSSVAWAQAPRYRPLTVGNTWTYAVSRSSYISPTPARGADMRVTSLRDTTIGGAAYRLLEFSVVGSAEAPALIAFSVSESSTVRVRGTADLGYHYLYSGTGSASATTRIANPLVIGGTAYPMVSIGGVEPLANPTETFLPRRYFNDFADPVGQARFEIYEGRSSSTWYRTVWTLVSAVVDGRSYGLATAAEERPVPRLDVRAFPSPARSTVTIGTGAARAAVSVVDASGRTVFEGEAASDRLHLAVGTWADGVYTVRATTPDGARGTVRFVVAR